MYKKEGYPARPARGFEQTQVKFEHRTKNAYL
jgi:hypothetical protein